MIELKNWALIAGLLVGSLFLGSIIVGFVAPIFGIADAPTFTIQMTLGFLLFALIVAGVFIFIYPMLMKKKIA